MKIGIVTQPLQENYGGYLQNYALQCVLRKLGHEPITIDYGNRISIWRFIISTIRSCLFYLIPNKRRPFAKFRETRGNIRKGIFTSFLEQNITKTEATNKYYSSFIKKYNIEALITGSDQVWRPLYNRNIEDMFLRFAQNSKIKKIAYAASFGTDKWEYTPSKTEKCRRLAREMDAVSVRESSGVDLCKQYLNIDASVVLDPTLLLTSQEYDSLCNHISSERTPFIAAYILDQNEATLKLLNSISQMHNLELKVFRAEKESVLSIEEWLAVFRDAQYVVTDSFHGTIVSIIFNKQFVCLGNKTRGNARFDSLLTMFGLQSRWVENSNDVYDLLSSPINWSELNPILEAKRKESVGFLVNALK